MGRRNIAIFHSGALGDFVLTWFIPLALRRLFPDHDITYITHASKGQLARRLLQTQCDNIDVGGWHTLFSDTPKLHVHPRALLDTTDTAICFTADTGNRFATNLKELAPALSLVCVAPLPPEGFDAHITSFYLQQLSQSLPAEPFESAIHDLATRALPGTPPASGRVLLHPGAGAMRKCWPLDSYLDLADSLRTRGHELALMFGEAETERFPDRLMDELSQSYTVLRPRDFVELTEELLNARMLITNDNGPGHLAAVLGRDVLSLFGPTDPRIWRPVGPRARVLHAENLTTLAPLKVLEAALSVLGNG